ncbi:MAG: hypothetical protein WCO56_23305 [Verrucomicrobiota bacterium]
MINMRHRIGYAGIAAMVFLAPTLLAAPAWRVETVAGSGQPGYSGDGGVATQAQLNNAFGVVRGPDGSIYVCDFNSGAVRKVDARGIITTVAGTGRPGFGGDGGPAIQAQLNQPHELRFDTAGDLYIADTASHRVRKVNLKTGIITTVAGTGMAGFSGDGGPAIKAALKLPISIQLDRAGNIFLCDIGNHRIRRVDTKTGIITTVTGNGQRTAPSDGVPFKDAPINGPRTLDFDPAGNLWLATREGNQVWKLDLGKGTIHLVAGTGQKGFTGNGGLARAATLNGPKGIAVAPDGQRVFVADTENHCVRYIDLATGKIEPVCGTGVKGSGPDGDALNCKIARPHAVFVETNGNILIGDTDSNKVRLLRPVR